MPRKPEIPRKSEARKPIKHLGFYSRKSAAMKLDGRSSEAKILRVVVAGLTEELGGKPTFSQQLKINIVADLVLRHVLAMGRYITDPKDDREIDLHVVALAKALFKGFDALALAAVKDVGPTLEAYLGELKLVDAA